MKVALCLPLGFPCPHLQIVSGLPFTQVQFPAFFVRPILNLFPQLLFVFRLRRSPMMKFHSSSASMETRYPPRLWQLTLFKSQIHPCIEIMYEEFLKVIDRHSTYEKSQTKYTNYYNDDKQSNNYNDNDNIKRLSAQS